MIQFHMKNMLHSISDAELVTDKEEALQIDAVYYYRKEFYRCNIWHKGHNSTYKIQHRSQKN